LYVGHVDVSRGAGAGFSNLFGMAFDSVGDSSERRPTAVRPLQESDGPDADPPPFSIAKSDKRRAIGPRLGSRTTFLIGGRRTVAAGTARRPASAAVKANARVRTVQKMIRGLTWASRSKKTAQWAYTIR
jgi:hypothetical protein